MDAPDARCRGCAGPFAAPGFPAAAGRLDAHPRLGPRTDRPVEPCGGSCRTDPAGVPDAGGGLRPCAQGGAFFHRVAGVDPYAAGSPAGRGHHGPGPPGAEHHFPPRGQGPDPAAPRRGARGPGGALPAGAGIRLHPPLPASRGGVAGHQRLDAGAGQQPDRRGKGPPVGSPAGARGPPALRGGPRRRHPQGRGRGPAGPGGRLECPGFGARRPAVQADRAQCPGLGPQAQAGARNNRHRRQGSRRHRGRPVPDQRRDACRQPEEVRGAPGRRGRPTAGQADRLDPGCPRRRDQRPGLRRRPGITPQDGIVPHRGRNPAAARRRRCGRSLLPFAAAGGPRRGGPRGRDEPQRDGGASPSEPSRRGGGGDRPRAAPRHPRTARPRIRRAVPHVRRVSRRCADPHTAGIARNIPVPSGCPSEGRQRSGRGAGTHHSRSSGRTTGRRDPPVRRAPQCPGFGGNGGAQARRPADSRLPRRARRGAAAADRCRHRRPGRTGVGQHERQGLVHR